MRGMQLSSALLLFSGPLLWLFIGSDLEWEWAEHFEWHWTWTQGPFATRVMFAWGAVCFSLIGVLNAVLYHHARRMEDS